MAGKVNPKVQAAVALVDEGMTPYAAAKRVGAVEASVYAALKRRSSKKPAADDALAAAATSAAADALAAVAASSAALAALIASGKKPPAEPVGTGDPEAVLRQWIADGRVEEVGLILGRLFLLVEEAKR